MNLGIVGMGVVGNAFYEGMKHAFEIVRYDKYNAERSDVFSVEGLCLVVDGPIFVAVPTPMNLDGTCNLDIIRQVIGEIASSDFSRHSAACCGFKKRTVVIKSTVPPGTTDKLNEEYGSGLSVIFNPEFLTEASPIEDFKNQDRIVLGGEASSIQEVSEVYTAAYPNVTQVLGGTKAAEMVKYVANCFLAAKVSFANEIYQICKAVGVDYNGMIETAMLDKRLGTSHWKVPGPMPADDGSGRLLFGFGGSCFVKDLNALIRLAETFGVDPKVMRAAWEKNLEIRPEKDWENLKGRAIL